MENKMRCVITGLGMINSIGNSVDESWNNCINGVSGIKEVKSIDTTECYAHLGAEAAEHFDVDAGSDADKMDRVSLLCVKAAKEALSDSKIEINDEGTFADGELLEDNDSICTFTYYNKLIPKIQTGSEMNYILLIGSAIISLLGITTGIVVLKRKNKNN